MRIRIRPFKKWIRIRFHEYLPKQILKILKIFLLRFFLQNFIYHLMMRKVLVKFF